MIQLKFTGTFNPSLPLTLKFGDEVIVSPVPIREPNLIMAVSAQNTARGGLANAVKSKWNSGSDLTGTRQTKWLAERAKIKSLSTLWAAPEDTSTLSANTWAALPIISQFTSMAWSATALQQQIVKTGWTTPAIKDFQTLQLWTTAPLLLQHIKATWQHAAITSLAMDLLYNIGGDITTSVHLPFGPRPPSYICSQRWRPQRSPLRLKFSEPATPSVGTITLKFSNHLNPVICDLDIGGGLIPPLPDLPTVDTTQPITPPRRRSYIMQPQLRCYRVSDDTEVNIISANWSISRSQWGATISLVCGSKGDKDLLFAGGPQEFKLVINGYEFFGLAERASLAASFGSNVWTVAGRSSIATLASPNDAPRSYSNAIAKGIAALVSDELTGTGWTLDYGPTQFNVPAGAFSYVNKSRVEAIAQIAQAVGAMIYPDGETKTLRIRPLWPVAPWAMAGATPAVVVHDDVILSYNVEPSISPLYNKVFVRGEQQGVFGGVRRTGTAGDKVAPDIVDALITDVIAARQRGTAELAGSGNKDVVSLTMPIMDLLPPCLPGQILGVTWQTETYKALVDSIQITAQRSQNGQLTVRQNVGALRSYD